MNNTQVSAIKVGSTTAREVRKGSQLVLAANGDQLWYKANERPSLDLRFADDKSLVDTTTGTTLVDHTRASSGTYVGSDGLIKTATTNLLTYSEDLNTDWVRYNVTLSLNAIAAPDGTTTADKLIETTANNFHRIRHGISSEITGVFSFYAKADERSRFEAGTSDVTPIAGFDLTTETIISGTGTIEDVGNGWYRCSVYGTFTTSGPFILLRTESSEFYTGDGTSGLYIWGAQLEQSSTVGEYIKTTSTINSAPRFDHDPTTGESLGLLVEESRTNLFLQSENFGTTWAPNGLLAFGSGSTLNAIAAPDGQTTADLITENTSTIQHNVNQVSTTTGPKRFSVFAKQGPGSRLLRLVDYNATDGAQGESYFNLSTGVVVSGPGTIQAFPNGWYRCSIQTTTTVTSTYFISIATSGLAFSYTGDGTSGIYLWGAQIEAGSFPTSYIPTEGTTVTRAADVASISGSNFSSWYRQDEGTVFSEHSWQTDSEYSTVWGFSDDTVNNETRLIGWNNGVDRAPIMIAAGSSQVSGTNRFYSGNTNYKYAIALKQDSAASCRNGDLPLVDLSATLPVVSTLSIGSTRDIAFFLNSRLKRLTYWPTRLPNETLQTITN